MKRPESMIAAKVEPDPTAGLERAAEHVNALLAEEPRPSLPPRRPTRASLRRLLAVVLRGDSDLDAFCHDYHEANVYRRFTDGMERDRKATILLRHAERSCILENLRDAYPDAVARYEHLLEWETEPGSRRGRRILQVAVPAAALAVVAILAWRLWPRYVLRFEPFAPSARGVVLAGPWMETEDGRKLCGELKELDPQRAVRCVAPLDGVSAGELRDLAARAGAVVVTEIDAWGEARVYPLGRREGDALLGGTFVMDLGRERDRRRAAVIVNALARLGEQRPDFEPDLITCPVLESEPLDRVALLALLVVPSCERLPIDPRRFREACGPSTPETNETCALAWYLEAEHNPDAPYIQTNLERLVARGPARFRAAAALKLARLHCKDGAVAEASRAILALSRDADACLMAQLSESAACVVSAGGSAPDADEVRRIEASPIDPQGECPERLRARSLARRGYWRERGGRWQEAMADYEAAYAIHPEPRYGLNLAQAWLHLGHPERARRVLDSLPAQDVEAALLRWIAAQRTGDANGELDAEAKLLEFHDALPTGAAALDGPDDDALGMLACADPSSTDCVYNVLRRHSSRKELLLSLAAQSPAPGQGTKR